MQIKTRGIVLKQRNIGESDRIITILSDDLGVIEASVKNAKSPKSSLAGAVQILCYSDFCLFKGKSSYIVNTAETINSFYALRLDVIKLSLAGYFCELICFLSNASDDNANSYLKLILNTLFFLQEDKRDMEILKSIFELRALVIAGFMPNLIGCSECGQYECDPMYFIPIDGLLICDDCYLESPYNIEFNPKSRFQTNIAVLSALRYIVFSEPEKLFSFKLNGISLEQLSFITEIYTLMHTETKFKSLEMYKSLKI